MINNLRKNYELEVFLTLPSKKKNLNIMLNRINQVIRDSGLDDNIQNINCPIGYPESKDKREVPEIGVYKYFNRTLFRVNNRLIEIDKYSDNKKEEGNKFRKIVSDALMNYRNTKIDLDDIIFYSDKRFIKLFIDLFLKNDNCTARSVNGIKKCLKDKYFTEDGKFKYEFDKQDLIKHIFLNRNDKFVDEYPFDKIDFEMIYRLFVRSFIYMLSSMRNSFDVKIDEQIISMIDKNIQEINNIYNSIEKICVENKRDFSYLNDLKKDIDEKRKTFNDTIDLFKNDILELEKTESFFKHFVGISVSDVTKIVSFYYKEFVDQFNLKSQKRGEALFDNSLLFNRLFNDPSNLILMCMITDFISVSDDNEKVLLINEVSDYNEDYNKFTLKSLIVLSDILSTVMYELGHLDIFPDYLEYKFIDTLNKLNDISKDSRRIFILINDKMNKIDSLLNKDKTNVSNLKHVMEKSKKPLEEDNKK